MSDETTLAQLPIGKVVCLEDRAQIERRGAVKHSGGLQRYEVSGLSLVAVERSLKLEVNGAKLVDAKLVKRWKEQPKGGLPTDASALRQREHAADKQWREVADDLARLNVRREVTSSAWQDLTRAICEGAAAGKADAAKWQEQLTALSAELDRLEEERRVQTLRYQRLQQEVEQLRGAQRSTGELAQTLECSLHLTLEGPAAEAMVRASYLVPCAVWRPAYRATLVGEQVTLEAEAVVWQRTGEAWNDVELWCSTARPTLGTTPPTLVEDRISLRPRRDQEKKVVDVAIREEVIQTTGEGGGGAAEFPGLDDGGETRLLRASSKCSIPTDGQPHRAGLFLFTAPAKIERLCTPELGPLVSLVAKFSNTSPNVLLAGPVDLIRKTGFVGRSQLKFTGAGETVALSFGSEDALRVVRTIEQKVEEARITGRKTTTNKITLFVSNAGVEPMTVTVEERIPVSEVKEVEVQVLLKECKPAPTAITKDGISRLEVDLVAHGQAELKFAWELQAASKVAGL